MVLVLLLTCNTLDPIPVQQEGMRKKWYGFGNSTQCCGTVTIYYGSGSGSGSDF